ncbi:MAG: RnfABCDGE type electron transport complex subunit D, partial [Gammaproteobacteria bacterium]|nr:RnfABCDGE type electron transport complex subunit D [Gammaproteobacteria bacterium]
GQTGATALDALRFRGAETVEEAFRAATFGVVGGRGFEWVNAAALACGLYLVLTRVVHWRIPLAVLLGMGLPALALHDGGSSESLGSPLFHWFSGATMLGAFFIATDPVTAPRSARHQWLFGIGIGAVTFLIRVTGAYPDGLAFAVLLGNLAVPALDSLQRRGSGGE